MAYQECPDCDLLLGHGVNAWHSCNQSKVIKRLKEENERLKERCEKLVGEVALARAEGREEGRSAANDDEEASREREGSGW
jgi:hypothetical protein